MYLRVLMGSPFQQFTKLFVQLAKNYVNGLTCCKHLYWYENFQQCFSQELLHLYTKHFLTLSTKQFLTLREISQYTFVTEKNDGT